VLKKGYVPVVIWKAIVVALASAWVYWSLAQLHKIEVKLKRHKANLKYCKRFCKQWRRKGASGGIQLERRFWGRINTLSHLKTQF